MSAIEALYPFLVCPNTRVKLLPLDDFCLKSLNQKIFEGQIFNLNNKRIEEVLVYGLITEDKKYVYRIELGLPILLPGDAIIFSSY